VSLKLLIIAGSRPNFIKVAPLVHAMQRHNAHLETRNSKLQTQNSALRTPNSELAWRLVHTGQHYDAKMSDVFFKELGIPAPDFNLGVGSGSHAVQTANIMLQFEPVCLQEKPDWVIVVGDVNSTMACTIVASKLGIKVAHVEAGLRSFDRTMPEESNRIVTDGLADLLFTPSEDANENLRREGIPAEKIQLVGNVMIDAVVQNLEKARSSAILDNLKLKPARFAYVTLHRPSNVDRKETLSAIMGELKNLSGRLPVVFPLHPRTRKMISEFGLCLNGAPGLHVTDPLGYHDSLCLTENARLVLTDSGGLQEESTFFRTPCLTLRPNTERPITVTHGSNRLTNVAQLRQDLESTLKQGHRTASVPPLWDGRTSERVLEVLTGFPSLRAADSN